jgi:hypothetical protein
MPTCCAAAPLYPTTATTDPDNTIVVDTHPAASADSDPDVQLLPQQQDTMLAQTSLATTSTKTERSKVTGVTEGHLPILQRVTHTIPASLTAR